MAVGRIGIVGAGVMGSEIAYAAALAGGDVVLVDVSPDAVARGVGHARSLADGAVRRERLTADAADAAMARITSGSSPAALAGCGIAIEAVSEVMDLKLRVVRDMDAALEPGAVIASNTSGLSITALGRATGRPEQVVGMHFFNPASRMPLVEVIPGADTAPATVDAVEALARALGKTPVRVRECPGFLVNRILVRAMVEAYRAARREGADHAECDAAVAAGGPAPMGPFALGDLIGLDTMDHLQRDLAVAYGGRFADDGVLAERVAAGRLGRKSGGGFHDAGAPPAEGFGEAARRVAEAYYAGAVDEALRCRDEEVAKVEDIDTAMRLGAGWESGPLGPADAPEVIR
jgi:3-hydroxybutyryl-CoA dehydrogenase